MEENKLTARERERFDVIRSRIDEDITNMEASVRLGLKIKQVQRIKRAVEKNGIFKKSPEYIKQQHINLSFVRRYFIFGLTRF